MGTWQELWAKTEVAQGMLGTESQGILPEPSTVCAMDKVTGCTSGECSGPHRHPHALLHLFSLPRKEIMK